MKNFAPLRAGFVKIVEINRRRSKSENVAVQFSNETEGETQSLMIADANTYGADRLWVVLRPLPIEVDDDSSAPGSSEDSDHAS